MSRATLLLLSALAFAGYSAPSAAGDAKVDNSALVECQANAQAMKEKIAAYEKQVENANAQKKTAEENLVALKSDCDTRAEQLTADIQKSTKAADACKGELDSAKDEMKAKAAKAEADLKAAHKRAVDLASEKNTNVDADTLITFDRVLFWVTKAAHMKLSMGKMLYGAVVCDGTHAKIMATITSAQAAALEFKANAEVKAHELYQQHVEQIYVAHVAPLAATAGSLYQKHAAAHVAKGTDALRSAVGAGVQVAGDVTTGFVDRQAQKFVSVYPEHAAKIPVSTHDRILLLALFAVLVVAYVVIAYKAWFVSWWVFKKSVCIAFKIAFCWVRFCPCCRSGEKKKKTFRPANGVKAPLVKPDLSKPKSKTTRRKD